MQKTKIKIYQIFIGCLLILWNNYYTVESNTISKIEVREENLPADILDLYQQQDIKTININIDSITINNRIIPIYQLQEDQYFNQLKELNISMTPNTIKYFLTCKQMNSLNGLNFSVVNSELLSMDDEEQLIHNQLLDTYLDNFFIPQMTYTVNLPEALEEEINNFNYLNNDEQWEKFFTLIKQTYDDKLWNERIINYISLNFTSDFVTWYKIQWFTMIQLYKNQSLNHKYENVVKPLLQNLNLYKHCLNILCIGSFGLLTYSSLMMHKFFKEIHLISLIDNIKQFFQIMISLGLEIYNIYRLYVYNKIINDNKRALQKFNNKIMFQYINGQI